MAGPVFSEKAFGYYAQEEINAKISGAAVSAEQRGRLFLLSARQGDIEAAKGYIEKGADPNTQDNYGRTALHMAAENGHADVAAVLLESGADPNIQSNKGWTALHIAAENGHADVAAV